MNVDTDFPICKTLFVDEKRCSATGHLIKVYI